MSRIISGGGGGVGSGSAARVTYSAGYPTILDNSRVKALLCLQ